MSPVAMMSRSARKTGRLGSRRPLLALVVGGVIYQLGDALAVFRGLRFWTGAPETPGQVGEVPAGVLRGTQDLRRLAGGCQRGGCQRRRRRCGGAWLGGGTAVPPLRPSAARRRADAPRAFCTAGEPAPRLRAEADGGDAGTPGMGRSDRCRLPRPGGSKRWASLRCRRGRADASAPPGVVGGSSDTGECKQMKD